MLNKNTFISKVTDGKTERIYDEEIVIDLDECQTKPNHLCWNCKNGRPSSCDKVRDLKKKDIQCYDFIKNGYQIVKNGDITKFIVLGCDNFQLSNKEQSPNFRKEVDRLITLYYGTETVEEAMRERAALREYGFQLKRLKRERHR